MTFGGCRQAWCFALSLSGREEEGGEKSGKLPQVGEGTAHVRLFCEQVPQELHPDAGPGCQDSSTRLWVQGQEFPSLVAERKYGRHMPVASSWLLFPKTSEILWQREGGVGSAGRV